MIPPVPRYKSPPRPDYEVTGPFYLMRGNPYGEPLYLWDLSFEDAIDEFVRFCCPPTNIYNGCAVVDRDGVAVISWRLEGDGFRWEGIQAAVDALRTYEIVPQILLIDIEQGVLG